MFKTKKQNLSGYTPAVSKSAFIAAATNNFEENKTLSGNGALKFKSTNNPLVDQFGVCGQYKVPRTYEQIAEDCEKLWAQNPDDCVKFAVFLRTISRKTVMFEGQKTEVSQSGAELRHEGITRMLWLYQKSQETFWNTLSTFVVGGCWKDVFVMLRMDLEFHDWDGRVLDWNRMADFIISGLNSESQVNLVKKYLPNIKPKAKCTTVTSQANNLIAKFVCNKLFGETDNAGKTYRQYRKMKNSGTAHTWQQLISRGQHDLIEFDQIHGRALSKLVKSKYLKNQDLSDKYAEWISNPETKDVKFTGFVHELFEKLNFDDTNQVDTVNSQFNTLVEKTRDKELKTRLMVVRDTSGSMGYQCTGATVRCYDVAKALALFFSEFLTGEFENAWVEFNSTAKLHEWNGDTPCVRWQNDQSYYNGSTNFQSVIELFVDIKRQGVDESHFPTGILCISDGMFDPSELGRTNVETARNKLRSAGFSEEYCKNFVIVLWNLQNTYYGRNMSGNQFETASDKVENVFYFSGFSASTIKFLTNNIKNTEELVAEALNQELIRDLKVVTQ